MKCAACRGTIRRGTGRRALVVHVDGTAAHGTACASCQRRGVVVVVALDDVPDKPRRPRLGFAVSEAPGVRGAIARHLRGAS